MRANLIYEENLPISIEKVFDLTMQWLNRQYKAKIEDTIPPQFIDAMQGKLITNTGPDPNWKKRIRVSFYELGGSKTLIRVEATALSRNMLRVEKFKQFWYKGLFSHLLSLLHTFGKDSQTETIGEIKSEKQSTIIYSPNCGKKIIEKKKICPMCGIEID